MAARLGNPEHYKVRQADEDTGQRIHDCFSHVGPNVIPSDTCHLVLLNTYSGEIKKLHFTYNLIHATVLMEGGKKLPDFENAYFLADQVRAWLEKHCAAIGRKKHVLSTLRIRAVDQQRS
jgi:hypothetical protein